MAVKFYQFLVFSLVVLTASCETFNPEVEPIPENIIIPQETRIILPGCLNANNNLKNQKDPSGDVIYNYIRDYLYMVDMATEIIENSYQRITAVENKGTHEFSYTGLDGETKNVSISESYRDSVPSWDYHMRINSETFSNLVLQAWWNESPLEQKIIFKPSGMNSAKMKEHPEAIAEIHYKAGDAANPYEKTMFVAIEGLTMTKEISYDPKNIVVFIGQNGNTLDISGASNNPNVALLDYSFRGGRNWIFVTKASISENIASVKLALPPSSIESNDALFDDYLAKQVIIDEIKLAYPGNDLLSDNELFNMAGIDGSIFENPGYFDQQGFLSAGEAPSTSYSNLANFEGLTPYIPTYVRDYDIEFVK